ncbi:MAG: PAS domain S-box protein [Syntrophobacterales bacterium]|nr:PAS domain S-box protein [Syntrophobacterales bacterium]
MGFSLKFVMGFLSVSAITVLVGLTGYVTTSKLVEKISNIVGTVLPIEYYTGRLIRANESFRVAIRTLMNPSLSNEIRKRQYDNLSNNRGEIEGTLRRLEEISVKSKKMEEIVSKVKEKQGEYFLLADHFINLSKEVELSGITNPLVFERDVERFEKLHYLNMVKLFDLILLKKEDPQWTDDISKCEFSIWLEAFQSDNKELKAIVENMKAHHRSFHQALGKIREASVGDGSISNVISIYKDEVKPSAEATFKYFMTILDIARRSSELYQTMTDIGMEELRAKQFELQAAIKELEELSQVTTKTIIGEALRESSRYQLVTLLGMIGGIILALITGLYHARTISNSIHNEMKLREKTEEALRKREQLYHEIFENPFTGIVIYEPFNGGEDFIIKEINKTATILTESKKEDVVGKKVTEAFPGVREMGLLEVFQRVYSSGKEEYFPILPYSDSKLERRWYENHLFKIPSGEVVAIFEDRTIQKEAEIRIKESQEKLALLFSTASDAIIVSTANGEWGIITEVNDSACRILGYERDELINMRIEDILDPSMKEYHQKAIEALIAEGTDVFETAYVSKSGKSIPLEVSARLFSYRGQRYMISIARDLTEKKEAQAEMENLRNQILQAQKLESLGRLASGVAHDFNNMLVVILGYGDLMLERLPPEDPFREMVEEVVKAAKRSAYLTQQLLVFSRKHVLQPEVLNINKVLEDLEKMLIRLIGEDISMKLILSEEIYPVMLDRGLFEQSIVNLVVNARDAMPEGGTIIIETTNVELDESYTSSHLGVSPGEYVLISVTDTGVGMDKEILPKIFDPFFTTKEKGKGTGLGLATVYGFVKQSGGNIQVYSEPGKGTTFKIYLPKAQVVTEEKGEEEVELLVTPSSGKHIMVVEDDEALRNVFGVLLSNLDYKVTLAGSGDEAISIIEEKGLKPDIVITDVIMPGMSGKELAKRIQHIHPEVKIIYMSGYTDNVIAHHGILEQDVVFLQKPFTVKELQNKIKEVMTRMTT